MNNKNKHRWQFGLLALAALIAVSAVVFTFLRPAVFPGDDLIRKDLGIPVSIEMSVFDRQTVSRPDGTIDYWATVHVAETPHRLVRVWCKANASLTDREKWEPLYVHDHYDNGTFAFRVCERWYGNPPTKAELEEFREFALNFN